MEETEKNSTPKLAPPTVFDGDKRKAKLFLQQLRVYITIKAEHFKDDASKVAFALSYMQKGEAARFAETYYVVPHKDGLLGKWDDFKAAFEAQFFAKTAKRAAFDRIVTLKQTGGVDAYISIFRKLLSEAEILNEDILMDLFRRGLKNDIGMDIMRRETLPTTIAKYMEAALEVEARRASVYGGHSVPKRKDPYAMDIDRVETGGEEASAEAPVRQGQLSAGEKDRRRRLGLCFKCGNKGLSRDCPNHPKMQAWKPSTNTRAATTAPSTAGPSARKVEVDETVLARLLAMEEKFNKMSQKDF
jgi:hypothetical protein